MDTNEKSPIIERLCKFIAYSGLTTSQFADKAGIPRPSMSQMLHGRNKSLNNNVLSKLNDAFPELNIVWLLFGRGDMRSSVNFETSETQNTLFSAENTPDSFENPSFTLSDPDISEFQESKQNSVKTPNSTDFANFDSFPGINTKPESTARPQASQTPTPSNDNTDSEILAKMINSKIVDREPAKKIASIIVLFTDNSFETFVPSTDN